ncbi:hypothetical protein N7494_001471 [Penicillium frequentans]|uniref:Uncharacterized protein n=1 Tax=Penicillium frequentans TaxID=3151616 RepID=A0AAD6D1U7_9EURO|nr:hypothetical protein N7494_001471 [Penicillium glabrum]
MSDTLVELEPDCLSPELARFLQQFSAQSDAPCVHPRPISFYDGSSRLSWRPALPDDDSQRDTYALLKPQSGRGKYLIIWDCDPKNPFDADGITIKRPHEFLLSAQNKLLEALRKCKAKLNGLFYQIDRSQAGQNQCLQHTCEWVQRMVQSGDGPFQGFDEQGQSLDPRTKDCVFTKRWINDSDGDDSSPRLVYGLVSIQEE